MAGGLWLALPDTPDKGIDLSYFGVVSHSLHPPFVLGDYASLADGIASQLWSMAKMFTKYPTLVQVCCCAFFNASKSGHPFLRIISWTTC